MSRGGFSLVEAVIALTLSTALVLLAGTTFVLQGDFYDNLTRRAEAHDNVRTVAERMAEELRSVVPGGITRASPDRLAFRRPVALGAVCDRRAGRTWVHLGMSDAIAADLVHGFAWSDGSGAWQYRRRSWTALHEDTGGAAAGECFDAGADTAGVADRFHALRGVGGVSGGDLFMVYALVGYDIDTSSLDPRTLGLYRTLSGGDAVEFISGLDGSTTFSYRIGGSWRPTVAGGALDDIEAVRLDLVARLPAGFGGGADVVVSWTVDVPLGIGP